MSRFTQIPDGEQRHAHRKRARLAIQVTNVITGQVIGQLGDLSARGLMLITTEPPRHNAIYQLQIPVSAPNAPPRVIEVGVQALWHNHSTDQKRLWAGFHIISITDDDARELDAWLARPD